MIKKVEPYLKISLSLTGSLPTGTPLSMNFANTNITIKDRKRIFTPLLFSLHQIIKIIIGIMVRINTASNIVRKAILGDVPMFCDIQKIEVVLNTKPHINPIFIASL